MTTKLETQNTDYSIVIEYELVRERTESGIDVSWYIEGYNDDVMIDGNSIRLPASIYLCPGSRIVVRTPICPNCGTLPFVEDDDGRVVCDLGCDFDWLALEKEYEEIRDGVRTEKSELEYRVVTQHEIIRHYKDGASAWLGGDYQKSETLVLTPEFKLLESIHIVPWTRVAWEEPDCPKCTDTPLVFSNDGQEIICYPECDFDWLAWGKEHEDELIALLLT